jgi:hypothetical protein
MGLLRCPPPRGRAAKKSWRGHGIVYYPGAAVYGMAIKDDLPTVQPYPKDY